MLRAQEPKNRFTPPNRPELNQWVSTDIAQIAAFTDSQPVLVDEVFGALVFITQSIGLIKEYSRYCW